MTSGPFLKCEGVYIAEFFTQTSRALPLRFNGSEQARRALSDTLPVLACLTQIAELAALQLKNDNYEHTTNQQND